jgi:hypothetical protein
VDIPSIDNAKPRFTLLLPSAIQPPKDMPYLTLRNSQERLDQTLKALRYWSKFQNDRRFRLRVVIGDNTGFAKTIEARARKFYNQGVLICMDVPEPTKELVSLGKGAAETAALKYLLLNLDFEKNEFVAKMTGRQICLNAFDLFDDDVRTGSFAAWPRPDLRTIDSRFYIAKPDYLLSIMDFMLMSTNDLLGIFVEQLYADLGIWENQSGFRIFKHEPAIQGQAGTTGTKISRFTEAVVIMHATRIRLGMVRLIRSISLRSSWGAR